VGIGRDDVEVVMNRLAHEHPIKWIAVMCRQFE
jgi:hypothetical protein